MIKKKIFFYIYDWRKRPKKRRSTWLGWNLDINNPVRTEVIESATIELVWIQLDVAYLISLPVISRKYDVKYGEKLPNVNAPNVKWMRPPPIRVLHFL